VRWKTGVLTLERLQTVCCGLSAAACLAAAVAGGGSLAWAEPPHGLRVRVRLDVTGELVAPAGRDAAPVREPVEMNARFDFEETAGDSEAVARRYQDATAVMRVGETTAQATLAADARLLLVAKQGTTPVPYLAEGFLSAAEFDLLETPFDSLLLDDMLPQEPVVVGGKWEIPADVVAGLLVIDTVESGSLEARVQDVVDGRASVVFSGIIDGAADGVPTHVTVEGSFTAPATSSVDNDSDDAARPSRQQLRGPVMQATALIRERRQASHVAPGFDLEARLQVAKTPLGVPLGLVIETSEQTASGTSDAAPPAVSLRRQGTGRPGNVWYRDAAGRFDLVHDRRWRQVENGGSGLVMRLVDRGTLVGQCSITVLPGAAAAVLPTRSDVQRDIERSLAGQIIRTDAAVESDREDGLRIVRLESSGTAGNLPFCWIHYVLAAPDGSRVNVTFMFEEPLRKRFADTDRPLIESLRLPATSEDRKMPTTEARTQPPAPPESGPTALRLGEVIPVR